MLRNDVHKLRNRKRNEYIVNSQQNKRKKTKKNVKQNLKFQIKITNSTNFLIFNFEIQIISQTDFH